MAERKTGHDALQTKRREAAVRLAMNIEYAAIDWHRTSAVNAGRAYRKLQRAHLAVVRAIMGSPTSSPHRAKGRTL